MSANLVEGGGTHSMPLLEVGMEGAEPFDLERGEQAVLKSGSTPSMPSQKT